MDAALNYVGTSSALDGDDAVPDDMAIGFGRTGAPRFVDIRFVWKGSNHEALKT